jgi:hypothetical protein
MITSFHTLCTVAVSHGYYRDICRDFDFIVPADSAATLRNGKLIARVQDGQLHLLYEADGEGAALIRLAGTTLRFGLKLLNPQFSNFSDVAVVPPLYRNSVIAGRLDLAQGVAMTGRLVHHVITTSNRPVTVTVSNEEGHQIKTETITTANDRSAVSFDLAGHPAGVYSVVEKYPDETVTASYYSDPELQRAGVSGVVEIKIAAGFYALPPAFIISFDAKQETLKYYVVAGNYTAAELDHLSVSDTGYVDEGRVRIDFIRVPSASFASDDIPSGMLVKEGEKIVLFKSETPVARRETARKKIQLSNNGDVLIRNLPQAGADRVSGDFFIHISKQ